MENPQISKTFRTLETRFTFHPEARQLTASIWFDTTKYPIEESFGLEIMVIHDVNTMAEAQILVAQVPTDFLVALERAINEIQLTDEVVNATEPGFFVGRVHASIPAKGSIADVYFSLGVAHPDRAAAEADAKVHLNAVKEIWKAAYNSK
ncbi:hypothetical protein JE034_09610 [Achromobacter xylosoxidans]|uniref:hypothetical protein n=1 Tax=Alcaligenes xylosoxydans xylosoxydans TaxID=85698 RepID=UPI001903B41B|nr:hypothetical protein [Achromobacter xylosoxidans]MBK1979113.1 hypothetical protein [Achromobacter xylosoxidans]